MGILDWARGRNLPTPRTPKGDTEPLNEPTGDASPRVGGTAPPAVTAPPAPAYTATPEGTPRVCIDITEAEALGFINKLTVALRHSIRYGRGETFSISSQLRLAGGGFVSGALSVHVYPEDQPPP